MARNIINFNDGSSMAVDDFKVEGMMIRYIEPYTHKEKLINSNNVSSIRDAEGFECGIFGGLFKGPTLKK